MTLVAAVESAIDLSVVEDSQCKRVRQVADIVLRPARQTAVQNAILLYWNIQCLHSDHVT